MWKGERHLLGCAAVWDVTFDVQNLQNEGLDQGSLQPWCPVPLSPCTLLRGALRGLCRRDGPDSLVHIQSSLCPLPAVSCPGHIRAQPCGTLGRLADVVHGDGLCFVFSWRSLRGLGREKDGQFLPL